MASITLLTMLVAARVVAGMAAPPGLPMRMMSRQFSNSSSVTSSPSSTSASSSASAAATTWHADVLVGQTSFTIGDADTSQFEGLWPCTDQGCDTGTPATFDFDYAEEDDTQGGNTGTGTFEMSGEVDQDIELMNSLMDQMSAAILQTVNCDEVDFLDCSAAEVTGPPHCTSESMNVCTMVNFAQITIYDQDHNEVGQLTMNGSSEIDESDFDCSSALSAISGALGMFGEYGAIAAGVTTIFSTQCN